MKKPLALLIGSAILLLPACQSPGAGNRTTAQSLHSGHPRLQDAAVIPSIDKPKTRTTNEFGGTTYGLGTSVYSLIGSSGLHSAGFSSHLESRLSGAGIGGVKVLVLDDLVILATETLTPAGSRYDNLQQKVLSPTGGESGRGPESDNSPRGTLGTNASAGDDNLTAAAARIKDFIGGDVKVLSAVGAEPVDLINRIQKNADGPSISPQLLSDNLRRLLTLAVAAGK